MQVVIKARHTLDSCVWIQNYLLVSYSRVCLGFKESGNFRRFITIISLPSGRLADVRHMWLAILSLFLLLIGFLFDAVLQPVSWFGSPRYCRWRLFIPPKHRNCSELHDVTTNNYYSLFSLYIFNMVCFRSLELTFGLVRKLQKVKFRIKR
jgi:hypothetical protein